MGPPLVTLLSYQTAPPHFHLWSFICLHIRSQPKGKKKKKKAPFFAHDLFLAAMNIEVCVHVTDIGMWWFHQIHLRRPTKGLLYEAKGSTQGNGYAGTDWETLL